MARQARRRVSGAGAPGGGGRGHRRAGFRPGRGPGLCPAVRHPYGIGFIKNKYIGRTFIQPTQAAGERRAHQAEPHCGGGEGKRVVLVDDSIVRGTTSARIVQLLREAGATEVHMRISSPPFLYPCYFGTDIDSRKT
ncbi:MAG: hypothetical protein V8T36_05180 [Ruthenibacterium lactatiformans]